MIGIEIHDFAARRQRFLNLLVTHVGVQADGPAPGELLERVDVNPGLDAVGKNAKHELIDHRDVIAAFPWWQIAEKTVTEFAHVASMRSAPHSATNRSKKCKRFR